MEDTKKKKAFEVDKLTEAAWDCLLPVKCILHQELVPPDVKAPSAHYFMVPRQGYLFLHMDTVRDYFAEYIRSKVDDDYFYLQCKLPHGKGEFTVPWHYTAGVILDIVYGRTKEDPYATSLELTLRSIGPESPTFLGYPEKPDCIPMGIHPYQLQQKIQDGTHRFGIEKTGLLLLTNAIKEAIWGMYKTKGPWDNMKTDEIKRLTQSLLDNDPRGFFQMVRRVRENGESHLPEKKEGEDQEYFVPVKFHIREKREQIEKIQEMEDWKWWDGKDRKELKDKPGKKDVEVVLTRFVSTTQFRTLGATLREFFPFCYDLKNAECNGVKPLDQSLGEVLICGSSPSLCTPMQELGEHMCCPDLFVHMTVIPLRSNEPRARPPPEKEETHVGDGEDTENWAETENGSSIYTGSPITSSRLLTGVGSPGGRKRTNTARPSAGPDLTMNSFDRAASSTNSSMVGTSSQALLLNNEAGAGSPAISLEVPAAPVATETDPTPEQQQQNNAAVDQIMAESSNTHNNQQQNTSVEKEEDREATPPQVVNSDEVTVVVPDVTISVPPPMQQDDTERTGEQQGEGEEEPPSKEQQEALEKGDY